MGTHANTNGHTVTHANTYGHTGTHANTYGHMGTHANTYGHTRTHTDIREHTGTLTVTYGHMRKLTDTWKDMRSGQKRNTYQKQPLEKSNTSKRCGRQIDIMEVKKTMPFIKKHLTKLATAEIRNSKRSYEQKLAFNIKHDSKSCYAYVRSKQKVQDKVGPLEGSDGNIITEAFLMAENLNEYFSTVFIREDTSALPVPVTTFEGRESDYLGQLIVTPKMVAKKIRDMKENKSPGVDEIPPKLLLEIVEQISKPLATVFNFFQ